MSSANLTDLILAGVIWPYCDLHTTCDLDYATVKYFPSLSGNAIFALLMAVVMFAQFWQGIQFKTWSFLISMMFGLFLEIVGYGARIAMHYNPFLQNPFLIYLITLTIAPVFFSAGIYLCFSRLIKIYDPQESCARFKPHTYTAIFMFSDFISLVLQAVGGAIADTANDRAGQQVGVNIMIGGLAFQVFSLLVFVALCADFTWRVYHSGSLRSQESNSWTGKTATVHIHRFATSLGLATVFIIVRSAFRVAELNAGFQGKLANEEIPFMILEGGMISLAVIALTIYHPGRILRENWTVGKKNKRQRMSASEVSYKQEPSSLESQTFINPNTNAGNNNGGAGVPMGNPYGQVMSQEGRGRFEPVRPAYSSHTGVIMPLH